MIYLLKLSFDFAWVRRQRWAGFGDCFLSLGMAWNIPYAPNIGKYTGKYTIHGAFGHVEIPGPKDTVVTSGYWSLTATWISTEWIRFHGLLHLGVRVGDGSEWSTPKRDDLLQDPKKNKDAKVRIPIIFFQEFTFLILSMMFYFLGIASGGPPVSIPSWDSSCWSVFWG